MKNALQLILGVSLIGVVFSGVLSYRELVSHSCALCRTLEHSDMILGYPPCVYALGAFALVAVIAVLGLGGKR